MNKRIEVLNLSGYPQQYEVYEMPPAPGKPVYGLGENIVGYEPDYWSSVTNVACPGCEEGTLEWNEAGYVPGWRTCNSCGENWLAQGHAEAPALVRMATAEDPE